MSANGPPSGAPDNISPDARKVDDHVRDLIGDVTDLDTGVIQRRRRRTREFRLKALVGLLIAISFGVFFGWLALRQIAADDRPAVEDLLIATEAEGAPPAAGTGAGAVAPATLGDCAVDPAALQVASTVTARDKGEKDPAMFTVSWDAGVINESGETILVTAKIAASNSSAGAGWEGAYVSVPTGRAHVWPGNYVTNNVNSRAGALSWRYVEQVLAVRDTAECGDLLMSPTNETAKAALSVEVPRLPANVHIPTP